MIIKDKIKNFLDGSAWSLLILFVVVDLSISLISIIFSLPFYFLTKNYDAYLIACYLATTFTSILVLVLYQKLKDDDYTELIKPFSIKEMLILSIPLLIYPIFNLSFGLLDTSHILLAFFKALSVAFFEEIVYRVIIISEYLKKNSNYLVIMIITSLVFSVYHLFNIVLINDVLYTVIQCVSSFAYGFVLSALFIRTKSIIPLVISHLLCDFTGFILLENNNYRGLINVNGYLLITIVISLLMIVYGLYLVRKDKRPLIKNNWKKR